jgi:hypothetical protein
MNNNLKTLRADAIQENKTEKLDLVSDIFRLKRMLYGMGVEHHKDAIFDSGSVFDSLYEKSMDDLQLLNNEYSSCMSAIARKLAGF